MTSRVQGLRPYLVVALVPALLGVLVGGPRLGGLLAVMWIPLMLTIGFAATSQGPDKPNTYDPRGRLHG